MKNLIFLAILIFSSQTFAAIGCLPGDCCEGRPCGSTPSRPTPPSRPLPCPTKNNFSLKRIVATCGSCLENEVCAEYTNYLGEALGYRCETVD